MWAFSTKCRFFSAAVAGFVLLGAAASSAPAGFTAVKQPKRQTEATHQQILDQVYGGRFVADASGLNFSNESGVTVTRLEDTGPSAADEVWSGKLVSARAVAAFGRGRKTAGYFGGTAGGQFGKILNTAGRQFDVSGSAAAEAGVDGAVCFGRGRKATGLLSSVAVSNRDQADHVVTYRVDGPGDDSTSTYLLCWEDKLGKRSDHNYNDMVIEVKTPAAEAAAEVAFSEPLLIPLPPAVWTGLSGLVALGTVGAAKRAARRVR